MPVFPLWKLNWTAFEGINVLKSAAAVKQEKGLGGTEGRREDFLFSPCGFII
jgi:hypothetical protein